MEVNDEKVVIRELVPKTEWIVHGFIKHCASFQKEMTGVTY